MCEVLWVFHYYTKQSIHNPLPQHTLQSADNDLCQFIFFYQFFDNTLGMIGIVSVKNTFTTVSRQ